MMSMHGWELNDDPLSITAAKKELAHAVRLDIGAAKSLLLGAPDEFKVLAEGAPPGKFSRCFLLCTS
jgi:hypothetical protein